MKEFRIEHVNTGCLYQSDGQKVTIAHGDGVTHFFDHSRMVDGTIQKGGLTAIQAIRLYVKGEYERISLQWPERESFQAFHKTADFKDIASQYRSMMNFL